MKKRVQASKNAPAPPKGTQTQKLAMPVAVNSTDPLPSVDMEAAVTKADTEGDDYSDDGGDDDY